MRRLCHGSRTTRRCCSRRLLPPPSAPSPTIPPPTPSSASPPNTRFPSSPNEIRGEGREFIATKNTKSHEKLFCRGIRFLWFFVPFCGQTQLPSCAQGSLLFSRESPRSGVNVVGLRPSLIAQHSLRSPSSKSTHSGMAVFQRSAPGAAREKHLPFAEIRGHENPEPRKTQKCTKSCSGASLIGGNARSSPPPRPFQLLGVLGELGVGRFHAKGAKPAKGSLGRSPFCGFSQVIFLQKGIDSGGAKEHNPDLL